MDPPVGEVEEEGLGLVSHLYHLSNMKTECGLKIVKVLGRL